MKRPMLVSLVAIGYAADGAWLLLMVIEALILSIEGRLPGVTGTVTILSDNGKVTPLFLGLRVLVFALSLFNFAVAWGLWKLRNWSRVAAVIEAAILLGLQVAGFVFTLWIWGPEPGVMMARWDYAVSRTQNIVVNLAILILIGVVVVYLLLPSTRRPFKTAA